MIPKRKEMKARIDYTDPALLLPKHPPDRDAEYLRFVRGHTCAAWSTDCDGITEAAHLSTTGRGIKASDYHAVALCSHHHDLSHHVGIATFQVNEGVNLWEANAKILAAWIRRGCR